MWEGRGEEDDVQGTDMILPGFHTGFYVTGQPREGGGETGLWHPYKTCA